jgi:hypothetical protein
VVAVSLKSRSVTLDLTWRTPYSTLKELRLRDAGDSWGDWITPTAAKSWTLPTGDGTKTVEAEFKDGDGEVSPLAIDTIVLDTVIPTGTLVINSGEAYTPDPAVTLRLTWQDSLSGVSDMRFRENAGPWGEWTPVADNVPGALSAGDGPKKIEAQFRDRAENFSVPVAQTIFLDQTAPTGTVTLENGRQFTGRTDVKLSIDAFDGGSGLSEMRIRENAESGTGTWETWRPFAAVPPWQVSKGNGEKIVQVQVRDLVGNVSEIMEDSVILDQTPPTCTTFAVNNNRPYVVPAEDLEFALKVHDNSGGSGVDGFKVLFDADGTWSDWYGLLDGWQTAKVAPPTNDGLLEARVVIRDGVENESTTYTQAFYLVERNLLDIAGGGKLGGRITALDVDSVALHLVAGDLLSAGVKAKAAVKKQTLDLAIDLVAPDAHRLIQGRYPEDAKKPMVKGYVVPQTGRYTLVLRRAPSTSATGTYALSIKVKQAKENKKGKGQLSGSELALTAPHGSILKAAFSGEGLEGIAPTIEGPSGPVPVESKLKGKKLAILPTVLDTGTGTYTIRFPSAVAVNFKWSLKLPKKVKGEIFD